MTTVQESTTGNPTLVRKYAYSESTHSNTFISSNRPPKTRIARDEPDTHTNVPRSAFPARTSRPRVANNRTRPYQSTSARPNSHRKSATPCRYFLAGNCSSGDSCRYRHDSASSSQDPELDGELRAFVGEDAEEPLETTSSQGLINSSKPSSALADATREGDSFEREELLDEEELYEIVPHSDASISEVRFHSRVNPGELRTYFLVQRQPVIEYEGNNVGVLSGGVLLGIPPNCNTVVKMGDDEIVDEMPEPEMASSSSLSPVSNSSGVELWKGPVMFDDITTTENLVWADEEFINSHMESEEFSACDPIPPSELPPPPPVIHRIIRQVGGHNRRHSLS